MTLTTACGWIYAIVWGLSFYPALYLNYTLKTSDSVSLDYIFLNIVGYLCYSVSLWLQLYSDNVIAQFMVNFDGRRPILSGADLFYAFHGLFILLVLLSQIVYGERLWSFQNDRTHFRLHRLTKMVFVLIFVFLFGSWLSGDQKFKLLTFALNLAFFKIIISLIKYIPQVMHNYRRKSMYGVSRLQLSLDVTGAVFCMLEFVLKNDLPIVEAIHANRGKVGITTVTFIFAAVFWYQIWIYGGERKDLPYKEAKNELLV